jgi:hypothetical protein
MHRAPETSADEKALGRGIKYNALLAPAVEQAQSDGAGDADAELAQFLMGMETAAHAGLGAVDPIDATDDEG